MTHYQGKLRAAFIGPCIGIGGGDGLMCNLVKHAHNIEWVGAAIPCELRLDMAQWAYKGWDFTRCPVHIRSPKDFDKFINHENYEDCVEAACKDANIIINWCYELRDLTKYLDIPIIDYAQNEDAHAKHIVTQNRRVIQYEAACSKAAAEVFLKPDDVTVIYNGIDPTRITPRRGRKAQRASWMIPDRARIVLFMGRFVDEKHPEDIIAALAKLPDEYIAVFVGHGEREMELYRMAKLLIPGRAAMVDPQYQMGDILAAADCFVLPSEFEGHPLALMEAMLAGVPCVYSDFTVMQELEEKHGPLGIKVEVGCTPDELAKAIIDSMTPSMDQYNITRNARLTVWENYTISTIAAQWEEYLHACVNDWWKRKYVTEIKPIMRAKDGL